MPLNKFQRVATSLPDTPSGKLRYLFRSAQPDEDGFYTALSLGVRTVIKLNHDSETQDEVSGTGLQLVKLAPASALAPDRAWLERVITAIEDGLRVGGVLVHCEQGRDRTGAGIAGYRVLQQRWRTKYALEEFYKFGPTGLLGPAWRWGDHEIIELIGSLGP